MKSATVLLLISTLTQTAISATFEQTESKNYFGDGENVDVEPDDI
jgi:hypothetical protein